MYSISGVQLDSPDRGWAVERRTKTLAEMSRRITSVTVEGRDGVLAASSPSVSAPIWPLYVKTPIANREALIALVTGSSEIQLGSKTIGYTVASVSLADEVFAMGRSVVLFSLQLDGVYWRSAETTSASVSLGSGSVTVPGLFPGMSAPVQDAQVRVVGACAGLQVTDAASGAWFTYSGSIPSGKALLFIAAQGIARIQPSGSWDDFDSDVSGDVDFGGPRGVFEITPRWTVDPAARAGVLNVATSSRSGASIRVRGRAAFAA